MAEVLEILSEVRSEKLKLALLNSTINAVLFFLIAQYALGFIGIRYYVTLGLSVPVFLYFLHYYLKKYSFQFIEEKNPAITELLRTARDTWNIDNLMTKRLFQDLAKKIQNVSFSKLVDVKQLGTRVAAIVIMSFILALFPPVNIAPNLSFSGIVQDIFFDTSGGLFGKVELKKDSDIYGESSLAKLGDKELNLNIQQSGNVIDLNSPTDIEKKQFSVNAFPTDAEATGQEAFSEKIPEDFELVKAYSLKVKR